MNYKNNNSTMIVSEANSGFFSARFTAFLVASFAVCFIATLLANSFKADAAGFTMTETLTVTGIDNVAPSVPSGLSATPVSSSEIDLSWTPSTDNVGVIGYVIYRDGVDYATTSATSFANSGLTPETTYTYAVRAFDASNNYSALSGPVSATTLATPAVVTPPSGGGTNGSHGGSTLPLIYHATATPGATGATINFDTNVTTSGQLVWGLSTNYNQGPLMAPTWGTDHEIVIQGLQPLTTYYVRVTAINLAGVSVSRDLSLTTTAVLAKEALANPSSFVAKAGTNEIALSWINPADPRFAEVRLVRSTTFFPKDQFDGELVYQGPAEKFNDTDVKVGTTYYYTIFSKAIDGSYSSGVLAMARPTRPGEAPAAVTDPFANLPQSKLTHPLINALSLLDFEFIQEGRLLYNNGNNMIAINGSENLTVRLAYNKVPEILKTIAITLADPNDHTKVFPFLLRVNADRTFYTATIGPLGRSGNYIMNIVVMDYQNQSLKRIAGSLQALAWNAVNFGHAPSLIGYISLFLILCLIILLILLLRRRSRRRNQGEIEERLISLEDNLKKIPLPAAPKPSLEEMLRKFREKQKGAKLA